MEKLNFEQMECVKGDGCLASVLEFATMGAIFFSTLWCPVLNVAAIGLAGTGMLISDAVMVANCIVG